MRITNKLMVDNAIYDMSDNLAKLYALQAKTASGKQFQRASDNPAGATAVLSMHSTLQASQSYLDTVHTTEDWMSANDTAMQQMLDIAKRGLTLAQTGVSDTQGASERQTLAAEMNEVIKQAVGAANTSHQGNFLFAGFRTTTVPFTPVTVNGAVQSVTYNGDAGFIQRSIGPNQTITQNIDGNATFSPLLNVMIAARDHLIGVNLPPGMNISQALQADLGNFQTAITAVNDASTANGARQRQAQLTGDRMDKSMTELKSLLSQKEDVNMAEAISNLSYQQTVYQTVLEVGHRAISAANLFDKLG